MDLPEEICALAKPLLQSFSRFKCAMLRSTYCPSQIFPVLATVRYFNMFLQQILLTIKLIKKKSVFTRVGIIRYRSIKRILFISVSRPLSVSIWACPVCLRLRSSVIAPQRGRRSKRLSKIFLIIRFCIQDKAAL